MKQSKAAPTIWHYVCPRPCWHAWTQPQTEPERCPKCGRTWPTEAKQRAEAEQDAKEGKRDGN